MIHFLFIEYYKVQLVKSISPSKSETLNTYSERNTPPKNIERI